MKQQIYETYHLDKFELYAILREGDIVEVFLRKNFLKVEKLKFIGYEWECEERDEEDPCKNCQGQFILKDMISGKKRIECFTTHDNTTLIRKVIKTIPEDFIEAEEFEV